MVVKKRRISIPGENRNTKYAYIKSEKDKPCADCKIKYPPYVMQFDHIKGRKSFTIGSAYMNKTMAQIKYEIAKCEVVCANCHAERTHIRRVARFKKKRK
jgi:hypothetical protein